MAAAMPAYQQRASEGAFQTDAGLTSGDFSQARQGLGTVLDSMGEAVQDPGWWLMAGTAVVGGGLARASAARVVTGEAVANKTLSAAEQAASSQSSALYPGIDRYRNITLKPDTYVVGATPGQGNFYTTLSGLQRSEADVIRYYEGVQLARRKSGIVLLG
jgi:hypothetical protein